MPDNKTYLERLESLGEELSLEHYRRMIHIRRFEEGLLTAFKNGEARGTTHTSIGQEGVAVAAMSPIREGDAVLSSHRCHGHYLAYGGDAERLMLEIMGHPDGLCAGLGGSQHLCFHNFYSSGVQGGIAPLATGLALARKIMGSDAVAVALLGDGTLGEGLVYESFNMASLWDIPVLFVIENNRIAQTTPIEQHMAGSMIARPQAFGIDAAEIDSNDIAELLPVFAAAYERVRTTRRPFCQIVHTFRLGPHSKGDDIRSDEEIARWRKKDPLLLARHHFSDGRTQAVEREAEETICMLFARAKQRLGEAHLRSPVIPTDGKLIPCHDFPPAPGFFNESSTPPVVEHLRETLRALMERDSSICLLGEDLLDPYGGAFKVYKGLSTAFPNRVFTTPVSEAGMVGVANGLAMSGLRPIVEIMFGDFTTLIADQVINHMTKFQRMYAGSVCCPVIVRTPMGGYRGYGPTHSQSIEKIFLGVPGLTVVAMSHIHDQRLIWERMLALKSPVLYVENKLLYSQRVAPCRAGNVGEFHAWSTGSYFPSLTLNIIGKERPADLGILTYGGMAPLALEAAHKLFVDEELSVDVTVFAQLSPLPERDLLEATQRCRLFLTLEEGTRRLGWGAEVAAFLLENAAGKNLRIQRCAALDTIVPSAEWGEQSVLPTLDKVVQAAALLLRSS